MNVKLQKVSSFTFTGAIIILTVFSVSKFDGGKKDLFFERVTKLLVHIVWKDSNK
jgi:hypothetical protein